MNNKPKHRKETSMRKLMAGMDLHSNNVVAGIVDHAPINYVNRL